MTSEFRDGSTVPGDAGGSGAGVSRVRSIRTQLLAIALIPCIALLATAATAIVVLANSARSAIAWSDYLGQQIEPAVALASAAHQERTASLLELLGAPEGNSELPGRRADTDRVLADLSDMVGEVSDLNAEATENSTAAFLTVLDRLPEIRGAVDERRSTPAEVDEYFARLTGIVVLGLDGSARNTPDAVAATEQATAANLLQAADLHSRAMGAGAGARVAPRLTVGDQRVLAGLVGAYRQAWDGLAGVLTDTGQARYRALVEGAAWRTAVAGENRLMMGSTLGVPEQDWWSAQEAVQAEMLALFRDHANHAAGIAEDAATASLVRSLLTSAALTVVAVAAFALAVGLAGRLVRRLRALRTHSMDMAVDKLPSILNRIHRGEHVDLDAETPVLDRGVDEIDQVAYAFSVAHHSAAAVAVTEARTRNGFNKVFLDIAHRSQTLVRRQLDILDEAENSQDDPRHLELLFQLDHLATRARRNAENLVVLGGGQPRRRWREPVPLDEIVRSAISETEGFARVDAVRIHDARVLGSAVADVIHLLAELIDNAAAFSPPNSPVTVTGVVVAKGIAVEIEDQGLGIGAGERRALNEALRNPPEFEDMAVAGGRQLGLFVVGHLAKRRSITVSLEDSAYGGTKAVVLLPPTILTAVPDDNPIDRAIRREARRSGRRPAALPPSTVSTDIQILDVPAPAAPRVPGSLSVGPEPTPEILEQDTGSSVLVADDARPALPRRRRQTNLVPELRHDVHTPHAAAPLPTEPASSRRSAEVARHSMSAFQHGTRQARTTSQHPDERERNRQ